MYYESDDSELYMGGDSDDVEDDIQGGELEDLDDDLPDDIGEDGDTNYLLLLEYQEAFLNEQDGILRVNPNWYLAGDDTTVDLDLSEIISTLTLSILSPVAATPDAAASSVVTGAAAASVNAAASSQPQQPSERLVEGDRVLKHSTATKFMRERAAVLFKVDATMNRAQLQELFAGNKELCDLAQPDELWVGYVNKVAAEVAVALVSDPEKQALLLERLPGAVLSTNASETLRPFMKEERLRQVTAASQVPRPPKPKKWSVGRDMDLLNQLVQEAGGIDMVEFAVIDVEAAAVMPGSVPLPLEFAVAGRNINLLEFTHPGLVRDEHTALMLSTCHAQGGHGIPFRDAAFLRRDYAAVGEQLRAILDRPRTILINRGAFMDINAVRWIFAASHAVKGEQCEIPPVHIFEIETLAEYLGVPFPDVPPAGAAVPLMEHLHCWYHENPCVVEKFGTDCHCAMKDSVALLSRVEALLGLFRERSAAWAAGVPRFVFDRSSAAVAATDAVAYSGNQ